MNFKKKALQFLSLIICFLLILVVSIRRDGKVFGHDVASSDADTTQNDTITIAADGTIIVNTTELCKDVMGYAGNVPIEIHISNDVITDVKALNNTETPDFFEEASQLLDTWKGKTLAEARNMQVDAISGATFSSKAIIENVNRGLAYAAKSSNKSKAAQGFDTSAKAIAGILVALLAAIVPLFVKNKRYRIVQQILNILVLGFWCGTFLSYSAFIGYISNGINVITLIIPTIMLVTAFVYPLFGKKSYYCTHVCPFGSLQELTCSCSPFKIKISSTFNKRLNTFRQVLWAILMICLWTGVWFDWIDYEPFSAFMTSSASWIVIALATVFILLSVIIMRPYCRFVCPTGTLLKYSQK